MSEQPSGLREKHRVQTQQTLVDAFLAILEEGGDYEIPLAAIAKRAGVSLRTSYRYFGDRQQLLDAAAERINIRIFPWIPTNDIHDLPEVYAQLVDLFETHPRLARVIHDSRRSGNIHGSVRVKRAEVIRALLEQSYPDVDRATIDRSYAALLALDHVSSWITLKDELALSPAQISESIGAAMSLIIDDLDHRQSASRTPHHHDD